MRSWSFPFCRPRTQGLWFFAIFILFALATNHTFFWAKGIMPWWDFAANDLLVKQTKEGWMLHGNYSRVGFFHPGPFYIYLLTLGEWLFHDLVPLFPSEIAAQFYATTLYAGGALAMLWWMGAVVGKSAMGGAIAVIMTTCLCFHHSAVLFNFYDYQSLGNFLISPWFPHLYMITSIYLTVGVFALFMYGSGWWPFIIFCLMQLVHGHASFLLLSPVMGIILFIGHAFWLKLSPLAYARFYKPEMLRSLLVLMVMLAPIALQLIREWPGEFGHYLKHAEHAEWRSPTESLSLYFRVMALPLLCLLLLSILREKNVRYAGVVWFVAATTVIWIYMTKGLDTTRWTYLIFWYAAMTGALFSIILVAWAQRDRGLMVVFLLASLGFAAVSHDHYQPMVAQKFYEELYPPVLETLQRESEARGMLSIYMEKTTINVPIDEFLHMLNLLQRDHKKVPFCFGPGSWNTMFTRETKCTPEQASKNKVLASYLSFTDYPLITKTGVINFYDMRGIEEKMEPDILHPGEHNNYLNPQE